MPVNKISSFKKGFSFIEIIVSVVILVVIAGITVKFITEKNKESELGNNIIKCIVDESASNLNSPACKKVINRCADDKTGSCKKLLYYSDDGVHSDEALSLLGNICTKGGEEACDILISRCIENNSNCEILGKTYDIKNYLAMKADTKNTGKSLMLKKLKNYYDEDVDNIVDSVIKTCISDKGSMACEILTSKIYEFNPAEKNSFILQQSSDSRTEPAFSKTGLSLAIAPEINTKNNEEKPDNINADKNNEPATNTQASDNMQNSPVSVPETDNLSKNLSEKAADKNLSKEVVSVKTPSTPSGEKTERTVFKAFLTTGEDNNIDYIKNKIYNFNIAFKEPENTKIKWLVSFDDRASWKKWNGKIWTEINTASGIENIDFSENGNTSAEIIKGLTDYTLKSDEDSLDFAVELLSTDKLITPAVNKVEIKYY